MISREERLARKREHAKRVYLDRKAQQICINCKVKLGDNESTRCATCEKRDLDGKARRLQTEHGRQLVRARVQRDREKRLADGRCMYCPRPLAPGQKRRCQVHAEANRAYHRSRSATTASVDTIALVQVGPRMPTIRARGERTEVVAIAARAPFRTKRATPKVQHKILTPVTVVIPDGWTLEDDIREELLALGELVALRKVG